MDFDSMNEESKRAILKEAAAVTLKRYGFQISSVRFYLEHSNYLFRVETGKNRSYVMKVLRASDNDYNRLQSVYSWLENFHNQSPFNVNHVHRLEGESYLGSFSTAGKEWYFCLFDWLEGKNLVHQLSKTRSFQWGALCAGLHEFALKEENPVQRTEAEAGKILHWDSPILFDRNQRDRLGSETQDVFLQCKERVTTVLKEIEGERAALIHADLHPMNIRIHKSQLYALDFDECRLGHPEVDIAICLFYVRHRENYSMLFEGFRSGYQSVRSWPVKSQRVLQTLFISRILEIANSLIHTAEENRDFTQTMQRYKMECEEFLGR